MSSCNIPVTLELASAQTFTICCCLMGLLFFTHTLMIVDSYDIIFSVGAFVPNHIKAVAVKEVCRITKPGMLFYKDLN